MGMVFGFGIEAGLFPRSVRMFVLAQDRPGLDDTLTWVQYVMIQARNLHRGLDVWDIA